MIKNERQYLLTKAQAARFARSLQCFNAVQGVHPLILKSRREAVNSQISDLEEELREYESLKAGRFQFDQLKSINELPTLLIKARIARRMTQKDLADQLGLKEQQIQRYEATDYASACFTRIREVVRVLGIDSQQ